MNINDLKEGDRVLVKYTGNRCIGFDYKEPTILTISWLPKDNDYIFPKTMSRGSNSRYIGFDNNTSIFSVDSDEIEYIIQNCEIIFPIFN